MLRLKESVIPTLTPDEVSAISQLKEKLKKEFSLVKLILFGSKARGDHHADSDVDLLVLVKEPKTKESRNKLSDLKFEVILDHYAYIMPILENIDDWETESDSISLPLKHNVIEEGIEIEV